MQRTWTRKKIDDLWLYLLLNRYNMMTNVRKPLVLAFLSSQSQDLRTRNFIRFGAPKRRKREVRNSFLIQINSLCFLSSLTNVIKFFIVCVCQQQNIIHNTVKEMISFLNREQEMACGGFCRRAVCCQIFPDNLKALLYLNCPLNSCCASFTFESCIVALSARPMLDVFLLQINSTRNM